MAQAPGFSRGDSHRRFGHSEQVFALDTVRLYASLMGVTLRSNRNLTFRCAYHVVWCPKYRRPVIEGDIEKRLQQLIPEVVAEVLGDRSWLVEMETMPDHVHLLVECDPQFGIHRLVRRIKGRTSRALRDEFPALRTRLPTLWTNSYFVSTVGGAPLAAIKQYVADQKNV